MGINVTARRLTKCVRQVADDLIAELLPQSDCPFISGDNEIELHGTKTEFDSDSLRVLAHPPRDSASSGLFACDVSTVADVGAAACLVLLDVICAKNAGFILEDENRLLRREPVVEPRIAGDIGINRIGIPSPEDRLED